jgi:hypothetical protein
VGNQTAIDLEQAARAYIDEAIAINRRHGMTDELSDADYERAVRGAMRALSALTSPAGA